MFFCSLILSVTAEITMHITLFCMKNNRSMLDWESKRQHYKCKWNSPSWCRLNRVQNGHSYIHLFHFPAKQSGFLIPKSFSLQFIDTSPSSITSDRKVLKFASPPNYTRLCVSSSFQCSGHNGCFGIHHIYLYTMVLWI